MQLKRNGAAVLLSCAFATPAAGDESPRGSACADIEPTPAQYSLIHPYHLPHLMGFIKDNRGAFDLNEAQQQSLERFLSEARSETQPRQEAARKLEKEIAAAAFGGRTRQQLAEQLGHLQQVKREIAEIHIEFVNRVRGVLSAEQYALLVKLADRSVREFGD